MNTELLEEIVSLTSTLVKFESTHANPQSIFDAIAFVDQWANKYNLPSTRFEYDKIPSIIIGPSTFDAPITIMAHIDVVAGSKEIFTPRREGNLLHGRGTADDKYAIALGLVLARECFKKYGTHHIQVMVTSDEEIGGHSGTKKLAEHLNTQFCIALDGGTPTKILIKEKGFIDARLICKGKAAHGAMPWIGKNAIEMIAHDIIALTKLFPDQYEKKDTYWHKTLNVGVIKAGSVVNQVPDYAEALLDIRFTENDDANALIETMKAAIQGEIEVYAHEPLFMTAPSPWIDLLLSLSPEGSMKGYEHGASDARFLSEHKIPAVVWGAHHRSSIHSEHEFLEIDSLVPLYETLEKLVAAIHEGRAPQ